MHATYAACEAVAVGVVWCFMAGPLVGVAFAFRVVTRYYRYMLQHTTPAANEYADPVGRPKKPPGERYQTPIRGVRVSPPELWGLVQRIAARRGETATDAVNQGLREYVERYATDEDLT